MKVYYSIGIPTKKGIKYLDEMLNKGCTAKIGKTGLLEKVMNDMYEINWIEKKEEAEEIIKELRQNKIYRPIFLDKEIWTDEEDPILIDPEAETELYITKYDDDMAIEYECINNKSILELLDEFTDIKKIVE